MTLFENGDYFGDYFERAYSFLMTEKPTSVEAERVFPFAGSFSTKILNSWGDENLDTLCIMKYLSI